MATAAPESLRLFLGVPLPSKTVAQLRAFRAEQPAVSGVRWVKPANWHVTVYFFGAVPVAQVENLKALVQLGLRSYAPFELAFDRFCLAPKPKEPRMVWARYRKHEAFKALVASVHDLYQQIDPAVQQRKSPIPHVTLARLRDGSAPEQIKLTPPDAMPPLPVGELVLWASTLEPEGARYEEVMRVRGGRGLGE